MLQHSQLFAGHSVAVRCERNFNDVDSALLLQAVHLTWILQETVVYFMVFSCDARHPEFVDFISFTENCVQL